MNSYYSDHTLIYRTAYVTTTSTLDIESVNSKHKMDFSFIDEDKITALSHQNILENIMQEFVYR